MFRKATYRAGATHLGLLMIVACSPNQGGLADAGATADAPIGLPDGTTPQPDAAVANGPCPTGGAGLQCLFDLYDEVTDSCDSDRLEHLRQSLVARRGTMPAWHATRSLFVSFNRSVAIAGAFNGWETTTETAALCGSEIHLAELSISSGRYPYKIVDNGAWELDPESWGFAYDDFEGNPDGRNSVLNTYDSGLGHLVQPDDELCSIALGNCRQLTTYLPPGYGSPQNASRRYPVIFMHDGQNIFDDKGCCFGHTGWEVNVALDTEIAAGRAEEAVIVGFDHAGSGRMDEYGTAESVGGSQEAFMEFQVGTVQTAAAGYWRLDSDRFYVVGSSLGGLISFRLAFAYPTVYAGAASLSGSFWFGAETNTAMSDFVAATGKVPVALYLDHGGTAQAGGDNYADNVAMRDQLSNSGYQVGTSPQCGASESTLCYFHAVGATHDELAWRDRAHRFLRYFLAP